LHRWIRHSPIGILTKNLRITIKIDEMPPK
jgi:hypothetical protein